MRSLTIAIAAAWLLALASAASALGDPLATYFGAWVGKGVNIEKGLDRPLSVRDIDLTIRQTKGGFEMIGKVLTPSAAKRLSIKFTAIGGTGTYEMLSALPALPGSATARARMEGDKLVVQISELGEEGAERLSRYERSVSGNEMKLRYTHTLNGEIVGSMTGRLSRVRL